MSLTSPPQNTPSTVAANESDFLTAVWLTVSFLGGGLFFLGLVGLWLGDHSGSLFKAAGLFATAGWLTEQAESGRWRRFILPFRIKLVKREIPEFVYKAAPHLPVCLALLAFVIALCLLWLEHTTTVHRTSCFGP